MVKYLRPPGHVLYVAEKTRLVLDCWRYVRGLAERSLRGAYVRCFLVFTDERVVEFKTSHYDVSAPPWWSRAMSESRDPLSHILWNLVLNTISKKLFARSWRRDARVLREGLDRLGEEPSLEAVAKLLHELKRDLGIRRLEETSSIRAWEVSGVVVGKDSLRIRTKRGEELTYYFYPGRSGEEAERVRTALVRAGYPVSRQPG